MTTFQKGKTDTGQSIRRYVVQQSHSRARICLQLQHLLGGRYEPMVHTQEQLDDVYLYVNILANEDAYVRKQTLTYLLQTYSGH